MLGYLAVLIASHVVQQILGPGAGGGAAVPPAREVIRVPTMDDGGPVGERVTLLGLVRTPGRAGAGPAIPVICVHGCPGDASNFDALATPLADAGHEVFAFDMPGYGASTSVVPSQSVLSQARSVVAAMEAIGIERAHVVGWSNGGGTVLHLADLAPERVATVTMIAAIGLQETEGSGNYSFEHFKYGLGVGIVGVLPDLIPHFGILGTRHERIGWLWGFWDTDQRRLRPIMEQLDIPVLILHGRRDFLIADWAAEAHHETIPTSRLVMYDAMHFLPWSRTSEVAAELTAFFERHHRPGVAPLTDYDDRAPRADPPLGRPWEWARQALLTTPWWVGLIVVGVIAVLNPYVAIASCAFAVPGNVVDYLVAFCGLLLGRAVSAVWRALRHGHRGTPIAPGSSFRRGIAIALGRKPLGPDARTLASMPAAVWGVCAITSVFRYGTLFVLVIPIIGALTTPPDYPGGPVVVITVFLGTVLVLALLSGCVTWRGRRGVRARLARTIHHEWWPAWLLYAPLIPYLVYLWMRHGHPLMFTCCNPGIEAGGGMVGESKERIMRGVSIASPETSAHCRLIDEGGSSEQRARRTIEWIRDDPALGGYPVVLKPDQGERGYGVRLAHSDSDVQSYFRSIPEPVIIQRFVPGPNEAGILWARRVGDPPERGFIFSVTRKELPVVTGDGAATLEDLILRHPRYRCQTPVFMRRHEARLEWVPAKGEQVTLTTAGNHTQGTKFFDGADLITPELEAALNTIAAAFPDDHDEPGGFDIGRFDIRYTTDDALRQGREFHVIELNGTFSESSNLYDPDRSLFWAYGWLFGHWRLMVELGAERAHAGATPMRPIEMFRLIRDRVVRPEMRVSD